MSQRLLHSSQSIFIDVICAIVSRPQSLPALPVRSLISRSPGRHDSRSAQRHFCSSTRLCSRPMLSTNCVDEFMADTSAAMEPAKASTPCTFSRQSPNNISPSESNRAHRRMWRQPQLPKDKPTTLEGWNKLIIMAALYTGVNKAIKLFREMEKSSTKPDRTTYSIIVNAYCKQSDMPRAWKWLRRMRTNRFEPDVFNYTSLIDGYMKEANIDSAEAIFRLMMKKKILPTLVTYNVLIHQSVAQLDMATAVKFWSRLTDAGLSPDVYTYAILIHGMGDHGRVDEAWSLFEAMQSDGIRVNEIVATDLMGMHVKHRENTRAAELFQKLFHPDNGIKPNRYTRNVLLNAVTNNAETVTLEKYYNHYMRILQDDKTSDAPLFSGPCVFTFTTFMRAFLRRNELGMVGQVYNDMRKHHVQPTVVTYAVLMLAHAYVPDPEACQNILAELRRGGIELNVVLYTIAMRAWAKAGRWDNVVDTYNAMKADNIEPNKHTMEILQWDKKDSPRFADVNFSIPDHSDAT